MQEKGINSDPICHIKADGITVPMVPGAATFTLGSAIPDNFNSAAVSPNSSTEYMRGFTQLFRLRPAFWRRAVHVVPNLLILREQCLLFSLDTRQYLAGDSLNWNLRDIPSEAPAGIDGDRRSIRGSQEIPEAILLQAPGFHVYGHWILDFFPRLLLIKDYLAEAGSVPIFVRSVPAWGWQFIDLLDLRAHIRAIPHNIPVVIRRVHLPLILKKGAIYCEQMLRDSFGTLRRHLYNPGSTIMVPQKIYIGRKKMPHADNQDEITELFQRGGFKLVYPEDLSLTEQVNLFARARLIVGEDSSAMHNMGFSEQSFSHIFARGRRHNYWHAAVASATGQVIEFHDSLADDESGNYCVTQSAAGRAVAALVPEFDARVD